MLLIFLTTYFDIEFGLQKKEPKHISVCDSCIAHCRITDSANLCASRICIITLVLTAQKSLKVVKYISFLFNCFKKKFIFKK